MFGHQNNDDNANAVNAAAPVEPPTVQHTPETITPTTGLPIASAPPVTPTSDFSATQTTPALTASPAPATASSPASNHHEGGGDLLELKQAALQELSPLVGHLEQSPEEKFRTTMMMIQASDDQSLLHTALNAAKQIKDEKARAQALLDVVNEINYFTQQQHQA